MSELKFEEFEEFGDAQSPHTACLKTTGLEELVSDTSPPKFIRLGNTIVNLHDVHSVEVSKKIIFHRNVATDTDVVNFQVRVHTRTEQYQRSLLCGQFDTEEKALKMVEDIEKKLTGPL